MEAVELKAKFHNLIDLIDDNDILEDFYRVLKDYHKRDSSSDITDDLTEAQKIRLNDSINQSDKGKTIPHETMKAEIKQWLIKWPIIQKAFPSMNVSTLCLSQLFIGNWG